MDGKGRNRKIISIALFAFSLIYLLSTLKLKMGTPKNPGPGFIPAWLGVLLIISTAFHLLRVFRRGSTDETPDVSPPKGKKDYKAILGILACTLVYPFILETFKFLISTFLVSFFMLFLLRPRNPISSSIIGFGISVVSFVVFSRFLGVGMPSGILETLLFRIGG